MIGENKNKMEKMFRQIAISTSGLALALLLPLNALAISGSGATMSLSPSSKTVYVNDLLVVAVNASTGDNETTGFDTLLNYDSTILQFVSANYGAMYSNGPIFGGSGTWLESTGKIAFSGGIQPGSTDYVTGSGTLATLTFRALKVGVTDVTFDFTLDKTSDTNVAHRDPAVDDLLDTVANGRYTIIVGDTTTPPTTGGDDDLPDSGLPILPFLFSTPMSAGLALLVKKRFLQ